MHRRVISIAVKSALTVGFLFQVNFSFAYPLTPDPDLTQGDFCSERDSDYEKRRYGERIPYCKRNVSWYRREKIYDEYNIPKKCRHRYTVDHFIPLFMGGNNADVNLWPEHVLVKATRPQLEQELFLALRDGQISQEEAVEVIVKEKTEAKERLIRSFSQSTFKSNCDVPTL